MKLSSRPFFKIMGEAKIYYKLVKEYKGLNPSVGYFHLEEDKFICDLPYSGRVSFPASIIKESYFPDYFRQIKTK